MPARKVATIGIRRTFQTVRLFPGLTVRENLAIGGYYREVHASPWRALLPMGAGSANARKHAQGQTEDQHRRPVMNETWARTLAQAGC
jgi:ABC-type branched-subunit amino acid transport system ATPase component